MNTVILSADPRFDACTGVSGSFEFLVGWDCYSDQNRVLSFCPTNNYEISNVSFPFLGPIVGCPWSVFPNYRLWEHPLEQERSVAVCSLGGTVFHINITKVASFVLQGWRLKCPGDLTPRATGGSMTSNIFEIKDEENAGIEILFVVYWVVLLGKLQAWEQLENVLPRPWDHPGAQVPLTNRWEFLQLCPARVLGNVCLAEDWLL